MCVAQNKQIDSGGAPQQINSLSPFQALLGRGHLSGMAPEGRTGGLMLAAEGLGASTKMVPIVGTAFNIGRDFKDGDYDSAASTAAFAGMRKVSPSMARMITAMDSMESGDK